MPNIRNKLKITKIKKLVIDFKKFVLKNQDPTCEQLQTLCDRWYKEVKEKSIAVSEYAALFNLISEEYPEQVEHINKRRDTRTLAYMAAEMLWAEEAERDLVGFWIENYVSKYWKNYDFYIHNPDGRLIIRDANNFKNVDFEIVLKSNKKIKIDLKINRLSGRKATFKVDNLLTYIDQDAWILIMYTSDDIPSCFVLLDSKTIKDIDRKCQAEKRYEMGNKLSKQIHWIDNHEQLKELQSRNIISELAINASEFGIEKIFCQKEYLKWKTTFA